MKSKLPWHQDPKELSKRRKQIGISGQELAQRIGKSLSVIRNIESGRTRLCGETAQALWRALSEAKLEQEKRSFRMAELLDPKVPDLLKEGFARRLEGLAQQIDELRARLSVLEKCAAQQGGKILAKQAPNEAVEK